MSGNDRDNRGFVDFSSAPPSAHALKIVVMAGRDEVGEIHVCSPSWSASVVNRGQAVRGNRPSRPGISRALAREFALLSVRHPVLGRLTGQRPRGRVGADTAQHPRTPASARQERRGCRAQCLCSPRVCWSTVRLAVVERRGSECRGHPCKSLSFRSPPHGQGNHSGHSHAARTPQSEC